MKRITWYLTAALAAFILTGCGQETERLYQINPAQYMATETETTIPRTEAPTDPTTTAERETLAVTETTTEDTTTEETTTTEEATATEETTMSDEELESWLNTLEQVGDAIEEMSNSEAYRDADTDTKREMAVALLNELAEQGLVIGESIHASEDMVTYSYTGGGSGGIKLTPFDPLMN